jgi:hypothetical protein
MIVHRAAPSWKVVKPHDSYFIARINFSRVGVVLYFWDMTWARAVF